jgi:DNA-binding NarL/FixJ family response regulator
VFDSAQFVDAVRRVAAGGTVMDPEVIARLLARNTGDGSLAALSPREREVLALMAEGRSNAAIGQRMVITERAVAKHTASIFPQAGPAAVRRRQQACTRLPGRIARAAAAGEARGR